MPTLYPVRLLCLYCYDILYNATTAWCSATETRLTFFFFFACNSLIAAIYFGYILPYMNPLPHQYVIEMVT